MRDTELSRGRMVDKTEREGVGDRGGCSCEISARTTLLPGEVFALLMRAAIRR